MTTFWNSGKIAGRVYTTDGCAAAEVYSLSVLFTLAPGDFDKKKDVTAIKIIAYGSDAGNDNTVLTEIYVLYVHNVHLMEWKDENIKLMIKPEGKLVGNKTNIGLQEHILGLGLIVTAQPNLT